MNLLEIYENNKQEDKNHEKERTNYELKKGLRKLISAIINGNEEFNTNNSELIKELDIKNVKKRNTCLTMYYSPFNTSYDYSFKINKTNIQKVQKYVDKTKKAGKQIMKEIKFKVGDKVKYIGQENFWGDTGEIIKYDCKGDLNYGVKFKTEKTCRHNLEGLCEWGYGWLCGSNELELISSLTLEDLQFADILTLRNGERYVVADGRMYGEDYDYYYDCDVLDDWYNNDLKRNSDEREYDIVKVERAGQVIYERKEAKEMTVEE